MLRPFPITATSRAQHAARIFPLPASDLVELDLLIRAESHATIRIRRGSGRQSGSSRSIQVANQRPAK